MYYEVYVDVLFVENLWMNAILLLLTAWAMELPVKAWKIAAAACFGSLGACMLTILSAELSGIGYFLGTFLLAAGMISIIISGRKHFWRSLFFLYMESFVLNGILRYLEQFHALSGVWFAVFSSGSLLFLLAAEKIFRIRRGKKALTYPVFLSCGTYRVLVEALYDTGNGLYDPISGKPVSILAGSILEDMLSKSDRLILPRMIPFHTIAENGVLEAYILDELEIQCGLEHRILKEPMVACMPKESGQYQLILHRDLLSS